MGISRRIGAVPRGIELAKTRVWVAHRKAIRNPDGSFTAGVFQAFKPVRIEVVVSGDESAEQIAEMQKKGYTPFKLVRDSPAPLFDRRAEEAS